VNAKHLLGFAIVAAACSSWVGCSRTIVVNSTVDQNSATFPDGLCTLREAIIAANTNLLVGGCLLG